MQERTIFKPFAQILKRNRAGVIKLYLLICAAQCTSLAVPISAQIVFDRVIVHQNINTLKLLIGGALTAVLLEGIISFMTVYIFSAIACRVKAALDVQQVNSILELPMAEFEKQGVGSFVTKMQEIESFVDYISSYTFIHSISSLSFVIIYIGLMALYSPHLTLAVLCVFPMFFLLIRSMTKSTYFVFENKYESKSAVMSSLVETIRGIATVKSTNMEDFRFAMWRERATKSSEMFYKSNILQGNLFNTFEFFGKLVLLALLFSGGFMVIDNEMTAGTLVAFYLLSSRVFDPVFQIGNLWVQLQKHSVALSAFSKLVYGHKEIDETGCSDQKIESVHTIDFDGVCFNYGGNDKHLALNEISLTFSGSKLYGLVGRTGSGKSTLTKLLHRHYLPSKGLIRINGIDISNIQLKSLRNKIGFVPQEPLLFNGTLLDNLTMGREIDISEVQSVARLLGSHEFIMQLPRGYDTPLGDGGGGLSGGQRQQICLIRALVGRPHVLLLDEPTSAMDYITEEQVIKGIRACCPRTMILMIAHRLDTLRTSDHVYVLDGGRLVASTSYKDLSSSNISVHPSEKPSSAKQQLIEARQCTW